MKMLKSSVINEVEFRVGNKYLYRVDKPGESGELIKRYPLSKLTDENIPSIRESFACLSPTEVWEWLAKITFFMDEGFPFREAAFHECGFSFIAATSEDTKDIFAIRATIAWKLWEQELMEEEPPQLRSLEREIRELKSMVLQLRR